MNDVIIVGAGPAGLSAAIYASRAGLQVMILEAGAPGGKLNVTADIENWPGTKATAGPDLAYQMYEHALSFGAKHEYGMVDKIEDHGDEKHVICGETVHIAKAVIIATGTVERKMGLEKEEELTGRGVSYCAVCDAPFYKEKETAVIGGGNSALEEAHYLSKFASKVHLIVRRDVFRADKIVQDKILANDKIQVHFLKKPHHIVETNNKVSALGIIDSNTDQISEIAVEGIFPFVGLDPVTAFAKDLDILDETGYILTNEHMETSIKGIFGAGDVRAKVLRQVVTATNDGAIAGQMANEYVSSLK